MKTKKYKGYWTYERIFASACGLEEYSNKDYNEIEKSIRAHKTAINEIKELNLRTFRNAIHNNCNLLFNNDGTFHKYGIDECFSYQMKMNPEDAFKKNAIDKLNSNIQNLMQIRISFFKDYIKNPSMHKGNNENKRT